ncbi:NTP transferase domain-containing protein [bacterium]|nr:NTP transferase domain-containing protein [bacterium]
MDEVIAILQARMQSERLPGKVMADICGRPLLAHVIERLHATSGVDRVVLAVPAAEAYLFDELAHECVADLCPGSPWDVLERFYMAARRFPAPITIRVTGDNPLIDIPMLENCIEECRSGCWDMVGTSGLPLGCSAEVFPSSLLDILNRFGKRDYHREHVTTYLYEHESDFRVLRLSAPGHLAAPKLRLTVDTLEDLTLMRLVYDEFYRPGHCVKLSNAVRFLCENPEYAALNGHVTQKNWRPAVVSAVA